MEIYLIRHGESTGNGRQRFLGWSDYPLSPTGLQQAEAVARRLASHGPMPVICSDLLRARQTAEAIAASWGGDVLTDQRWRETNFGLLDDRPWDELSNDAALSRQMETDPLNTRWPNGESPAQMAERVKDAFNEICARTDERLTIVAHGGPIHAVLADCLGIPQERYWVLMFDHAGLTHLRVDKEWTSIITTNDTSHLQGVLLA